MSPAKHSYVSVTDGQTDRRTDDGQSDPCVLLCFAGDTKNVCLTYGTRNMRGFFTIPEKPYIFIILHSIHQINLCESET